MDFTKGKRLMYDFQKIIKILCSLFVPSLNIKIWCSELKAHLQEDKLKILFEFLAEH